MNGIREKIDGLFEGSKRTVKIWFLVVWGMTSIFLVVNSYLSIAIVSEVGAIYKILEDRELIEKYDRFQLYGDYVYRWSSSEGPEFFYDNADVTEYIMETIVIPYSIQLLVFCVAIFGGIWCLKKGETIFALMLSVLVFLAFCCSFFLIAIYYT